MGDRTEIYVNNKTFWGCKYLLISIPVERIRDWDHYKSMDEIIKATGEGEEDTKAVGLTPEEEFRGHCSNIQAWAENGYDFRLLDTRLSIPIVLTIMRDILREHEHNKQLFPTRYKEKFRRFFFQAMESLDDYISKNKAQDFSKREYLREKIFYGKFEFLYDVFFKQKDIFFEPEEIEGCEILSSLYAYFLPNKEREIFMRKRNYWERKLWGKNIEYRRFLRRIRDHEEGIENSDPIDYLPYLYAQGKFKGNGKISHFQAYPHTELVGEDVVQRNYNLIVRDEKGYFWKETGKVWEGW